ncbi:MAG: gamma-glutamyltransferase [Oscillospiraceae bacterium]|nr:gamma-glutamyltransferase [Oscillospiraceae bacterium]
MKRKILIPVAVVLIIAFGALGFRYWQMSLPEETTGYTFSPETPGGNKAKRSYSVSSSSDIATDVGMSVLEAGGNAVDAAVAVAYTLAVVEPYGSGIGGSGGLVVYDMNNNECVFYDYRASAGSASYSSDSIGVPGLVAGMEACLSDYGTMTIKDLLDPALHYAEKGFEVNAQLGLRLSSIEDKLNKFSWLHNENGEFLSEGDIMYQPELAKVIKAIQAEGAKVFYSGWIADDIAANTSLTKEDLAGYQVYKRNALKGYFEGYTVYSANSPLSGITLIQMLEMAEELDIANPKTQPLDYLAQLKQITATAYGSRYSTIGDPSFYGINENELISREYIRSLLALGYDDEDYDKDYEGMETTSFSIVDSSGLAVSATNTLTQFWGARIAVDGIYMNSTNDNFSSSGINKYEPGKRSRTFTAPTIITGDNGYVMAIGTPGGNNIPTRLFGILVDILKFGEEPQQAVFKPGILYQNGVLTMGRDEENPMWFDTSVVKENIVWKAKGIWWGTIALAGYSDEQRAFAAFDDNRGATKAGIYNP